MRQIKYTVRFRLQGAWFWRSIKGVVGDACGPVNRFFALEDGRRFEVPLTALFEFGKEREDNIRANMRKEGAANI